MQEQELGAFCWERVRFQDLVYYRQRRNYVHLLFIQIYLPDACQMFPGRFIIFLRYKEYNYS